MKYSAHAAGWVAFYLLPYLLSFKGQASVGHMFRHSGDVVHLISYGLLVVYAYANYEVFIPRFYLSKGYATYALLVAGSLLVVVWLPNLFEPAAGLGMHNAPSGSGPPPVLFGMNYNIILFLCSTFAAISTQSRLQLLRIEKEKLDAQLSFLKARINPHFLFNTLNSIYALALAKSDKTADAVVQLSDLMRYITTDAGLGRVALRKEIDFIAHYVALQQLRLNHTAQIEYEVQGNSAELFITPLLLISFVENAFKHGVSPEQPSPVRIAITIEAQTLQLNVCNYKVQSVQPENLTGIGIKNTKHILDTLYAGKHVLHIADEAKTYTVHLSIKLND